MKVILSRKGFDSEFGGYPSPILPNGKMISLPIPNQIDDIKYSDVKADETTCYGLMKDLNLRIKSGNERLEIDEATSCHLDPDIFREAIYREPNWRPLFGQVNAAQGHLRRQAIDKDDLFLFFGWFRKTRYNNGKLLFDPQERDFHAIFGYLQIGDIKRVDQQCDIPKWMRYHPHANDRRKGKTNTIYIAGDSLSWDKSLPAAGRLIFNEKLVLTKKGLSRSKWDLPDCFREAKISYHKHPWKNGYFQSAGKGQEFVIKDNKGIEEWVRALIEKSQIDI